MLSPYKRFIELSLPAQEIAREQPYIYYIRLVYSQMAAQYLLRMFYKDAETDRIDLPPEKIEKIKAQLTTETAIEMKIIVDELREASPRGRLELLKWAKDHKFFRNTEGYIAYRESEDYIYGVNIYFYDDAVAKCFCYPKKR